MVTIQQVAKRAGVSVATTYKVFSSHYITSDEIREKVLTAAEELGYVHKKVSKSDIDIKNGKIIAVIIADTAAANGFYNFVIKTLMNELDRFGYRLVVQYTEKNSERQESDIQVLIEHKLIDGIILMPSIEQPLYIVSQLIQNNFPVLQLFDKVYKGADSVLFDDELGTYLAVKHLIQCGHTDIMLETRTTNHTNSERIAGFHRAFREAGLPVRHDMVQMYAYAENIKDMMKDRIVKIRPTAILSVSEAISTCTIQSIRELKLSIPDDISLIAYDDFSWLAAFEISAVSHSFESSGTLAAKLIHNRVLGQTEDKHDQPTILTLDPKLISRNSVKIIK